MSPQPLRCSLALTCTVLLITCLSAQWLSRKDVIKKLPLNHQKAILNKILNLENVHLTADLPPQLNNKIPDIVENLVNRNIDMYLDDFPEISKFLGPVISVGIDDLKSVFGASTCPTPPLPEGGYSWTCTDTHRYNSVCTITCKDGYKVDRNNRAPWNVAMITCRADETWTLMPVCKDVSPPFFTNCPGYTKAYADRARQSTVVQWDQVVASDSSGHPVTITLIRGKPPGSRFSEGANEVAYEAVDAVGLTETCIFYINVEVLHCPVPVMAKPKVKVGCKSQFSYGSTCTLHCPLGLALLGSESITCEKRWENNMYWAYSGSEPDCAVCNLDTQSVEISSKRVESFRIDNLKPDTDYVFTVYSMNEHGRREVTSQKIRTKPADETWTMPRTTTTPLITPKPFSKVTPCPRGFVSPTGFTPNCKRCPDNQEPNVEKTSCQWCIRDAEIGYICSLH